VAARGPAGPASRGGEQSAATSSALDVPHRPIRARITLPDQPLSRADQERRDRLVRQRASMTAASCPTCGNQPVDARERWQQRQDLAVTWLYPDPDDPEQLLDQRHCRECQPHQELAVLECARCGDGPFLTAELAEQTHADELPAAVKRWLTSRGWSIHPELICSQHPR